MISRIYVEGYVTSIPGYFVVSDLRKHFNSCGEVLHVYIPGYVYDVCRNINRFALVYLRGEGAEEKALELNGSKMGDHKLLVKAYPFHTKDLEPELALTRDTDILQPHRMHVKGFDTSLSEDYVKSTLIQHFSKCGTVLRASAHKDESEGALFDLAHVTLEGQDAIEKALQLGGCDVPGFEKVEVSRVTFAGGPPRRHVRAGCFPNMLMTMVESEKKNEAAK
ncbi:unnamed protein product [Thlaspi arvense]|uniref:RRM domain-containing protein n=1 Tax=Thlaspi arvense TaxID=13288 RepID=A0AAU9SWY9_THLAR|nr:unnamed protein product [Thlaspi arvense]